MRGQVLSVSSSLDSVWQVIQPEGVDHIFVFSTLQHAELSTINGEQADWYDLTAGTSATGYNIFINLTDAHTYRVVQDAQSETFVVFDYSQYRLTDDSLSVLLSCDGTLLNTHIRAMEYTDTAHLARNVIRECSISYNTLTWDESGWMPAVAEDSIYLASNNSIQLPKQLTYTDYTIYGDQIAEYFYHTQDSISSIGYDPIAFAHHAQSYTTTRGTALENEVERPIQETTIKGSAPLNILFRANASGPIDYYLWTIRHFENVIGTRTESEQRFIFEEKGAYTVQLEMANAHDCRCDTTFEDISVSESLLLVPNVFTPNGDGANDEFRVAYRSIRQFHCWVYNRWGHLVYEWDDPAKGWDGTIGGRPAPEGAYYYIIRALGTDAATDQYMSKPKFNKTRREHPDNIIGVYQLSGAVNLLRGKR